MMKSISTSAITLLLLANGVLLGDSNGLTSPSLRKQPSVQQRQKSPGDELSTRLQTAKAKRDRLERQQTRLESQCRTDSAGETGRKLRKELQKVQVELQQIMVDVAWLEHEYSVSINRMHPGIFPDSTMRRLKLLAEAEEIKLERVRLDDEASHKRHQDEPSATPQADVSKYQRQRALLEFDLAKKHVEILKAEYVGLLHIRSSTVDEKRRAVRHKLEQAVERVKRLEDGVDGADTPNMPR